MSLSRQVFKAAATGGSPSSLLMNAFSAVSAHQEKAPQQQGTLLERIGAPTERVAEASKAVNVNVSKSEVGAGQKAQIGLGQVAGAKADIAQAKQNIIHTIADAQAQIISAAKESGYEKDLAQIFPRSTSNSGDMTAAVIGGVVAPGLSNSGMALDIIKAAKSPKDIAAAKAEILGKVTVAQKEIQADTGATPAIKNPLENITLADLDSIMLFDPDNPSEAFPEVKALNTAEFKLNEMEQNLKAVYKDTANRNGVATKDQEMAGVGNIDLATGKMAAQNIFVPDSVEVALAGDMLAGITMCNTNLVEQFNLVANITTIAPELKIPEPHIAQAATATMGMGASV